MQNKIIKLFVLFVVLFSLQSFSQTTPKSNHPLLDKYYPRPQVDTTATVANPVPTAPETRPASPASTAAPVTTNAITTKPAIATATIQAPEPAVATEPSTTPPPVTTAPETTAPSVTALPSLNSTSAVTTTAPTVNKPVVTVPVVPAQKTVKAQPAPSQPYIDTRLGSSSPLYNTYEKNNNGAGSVTTSPK